MEKNVTFKLKRAGFERKKINKNVYTLDSLDFRGKGDPPLPLCLCCEHLWYLLDLDFCRSMQTNKATLAAHITIELDGATGLSNR